MRTERINHLEQLNSMELRILDGGRAELDGSWQLNIRQAPCSRLYYIRAGEAWLEWQGGRLRLAAGRLYLIPAGLSFSAGCEGTAEKLYFHLQLLKQDGYDLTVELLHPASLAVEEEKYQRLQRLCGGCSMRECLALKAELLADLLAVLEAEGAGAASYSAHSPAVQAAMTEIRSHLSAALTVQAVAEKLYLSERTLTKAFRRELGQTVGQYIDEMVFLEASRQLLLTERPIGEISDGLGFCDQFYFSRRFRMRFGKSPSAYRRAGRIGS